MQFTNRSGEEGEEPATYVCDPGSELRLGGGENRSAKIINGMKEKEEKLTALRT